MKELRTRVNGVTCIKVIPEPIDSINYYGRKKVNVRHENVSDERVRDLRDWAELLIKSNSYEAAKNGGLL